MDARGEGKRRIRQERGEGGETDEEGVSHISAGQAARRRPVGCWHYVHGIMGGWSAELGWAEGLWRERERAVDDGFGFFL